MNNHSHTENQQDYLAAKFHIDETHVVQASHLAFLKIQSWKFALRTPSIGARFRDEAAEMLHQSFFLFQNNADILEHESFDERCLN